jgi:hypothetical protein
MLADTSAELPLTVPALLLQMRDNPMWSFQLRNTKSTTPAQAVGGRHGDAHRVDQHSVLEAVALTSHQRAQVLGENRESNP